MTGLELHMQLLLHDMHDHELLVDDEDGEAIVAPQRATAHNVRAPTQLISLLMTVHERRRLQRRPWPRHLQLAWGL